MVINKVRDKMGSLCIICSLGQFSFHLTSTLWPFTCPWAHIKFAISTPLHKPRISPFDKKHTLSEL